MAIKMSQVHLNHGDSPTYSSNNGNNSSDSHHFKRAIKLRMIVFAFLQALFELVKKKSDAELEKTSTALRRDSHNRVHPDVSRSLQLKFSREMPGEVFTGECIVAKGERTLEVALVDGATGDPVRYGPMTSGIIEIVPVEENFDTSRVNWTSEDFNSKIVVGEDGRKSLLGKAYLKMKEGNAPVCGIKFKHTRKWMKKSKFRLGARFVDQLNAIRIREAVSEPFIIKDRRGKTKKHYPPSPTDEVWRLRNIRKEGAFHKRLVEKNILTVEDFRIEFSKNREELRDILGNMSNDMWKATSDHALTCQLNARIYFYTPQESEQKFTVVFNANEEVIWLYSGHDFTCIESLSEHQQDYAHMLMETAFANWENVSKFCYGASCSCCPCLSSLTNDLAAPSTAFGNSELQPDKNNCLGSELSQTSAADILSHEFASLSALSQSDTDGFSQLFSDDNLAMFDQQIAPSNSEAAHSDESYSDWVNEYMQDNGIHSLSLTDAGPSSSTCHQMQHNEDVNSFQNLVSDPGNFINGMKEHYLQSVSLKYTCQSYQQELDIDQPSAGVTTNSPGVAAISKCSTGWAKMSSLVRWFSLKKAITLKRLHVAKKRRLY